MVYNGNGNLRLATYERVIFGLLGFLSLAALTLSSWALLEIVHHGEQLAVLNDWKARSELRGPP